MASSMLPLDKIVADIVAMGFSHGQVWWDGMVLHVPGDGAENDAGFTALYPADDLDAKKGIHASTTWVLLAACLTRGSAAQQSDGGLLASCVDMAGLTSP